MQSRYWPDSPPEVRSQVKGKKKPRSRGRERRPSRMGEHDKHCSSDNMWNEQQTLPTRMLFTTSEQSRQQRNVVAPDSDSNANSSQYGKHRNTTVSLRTEDRASTTTRSETTNTLFGATATGKPRFQSPLPTLVVTPGGNTPAAGTTHSVRNRNHRHSIVTIGGSASHLATSKSPEIEGEGILADIRESQDSRGATNHLDKRKRTSSVLPGADIESETSSCSLPFEHGNAENSNTGKAGYSQSYTGTSSHIYGGSAPMTMPCRYLDQRASEATNVKRRSPIWTSQSVRSTASNSEDLRTWASFNQNQRPNKTSTATKRPSTSINHTHRQVTAIDDENQRPATAQRHRRPTVEIDAAMSRSALLPQTSGASLAALAPAAVGRIAENVSHASGVRPIPGTAWNRPGDLGDLDPEADPSTLMPRNNLVTKGNNGAASGAEWGGDDQVQKVTANAGTRRGEGAVVGWDKQCSRDNECVLVIHILRPNSAHEICWICSALISY